LIIGAIGVTDFEAFIPFRGNQLDFLIMVATFVVSLGLTVKEGRITGVVLSIMVCSPTVCGHAQLGSLWPGGGWEGEMIPVQMDAALSFANTRRLQEFCLRAVGAAGRADPSVSYLILDCKSINGTDMTGCEAVENLAISLQKRKKSLVLANLKQPLTQAMYAAGVNQHIEAHGGHLCWNIAQAIALVNGGDPTVAKEAVNDLHSRVQSSTAALKQCVPV
jgi:MFS superfamily sulfate permease-like transporter